MTEAAGALDPAEFDALMAPLGPFGAAPRLAAGVSGGPHSLALALLAADWARRRGGDLLALVVDHGLRPGSGAEADGVLATLARRGIGGRVLRLGLLPGPGAQERAREGRLAAMLGACAEEGRPWLLLGHHRVDQAETVLFRALRGSGPGGLSAMAPVRAEAAALVLRPLLGVAPARLEAEVAVAGLEPVRDPANADSRFARTGLRRSLADPAGTGPAVAALAEAASAFGRRRAEAGSAVASRLAVAARLRPEGHAEVDPLALGNDEAADAALAALLRAVGGAAWPPSTEAARRLRRRGCGTLAGAWLRPGGAGWRVLREPGAVRAPVPARPGALWDGRFRLMGPGAPDCAIGALGTPPADLRRAARAVSATILATFPAIWRDGVLVAVPALLYPDSETCARFALVFAPVGGPVAGWSRRSHACAKGRSRPAHSKPALPTPSPGSRVSGRGA
ncbi:tRNA lysidine(34) synthetase TilS [Craurococcus roseus]|uniref:tRNA(Ile)-lysidine synthase n=1 Tax=Craurococcus roseus TaxID=77585 RepID=A0ABP3PRI4_9PROT